MATRAGMLLAACALSFLAGCAHAAPSLSSHLQSFGAAVTFSATASPAARDTIAGDKSAAVCVSERCLHVRSRHERKRPLRIQLSFYSPSLTDDPFRQ